ncbi:MAG: hypothetical protein Q4G04_05900, partial [bacterium]|nr:hypothetical protein [bacterium]
MNDDLKIIKKKYGEKMMHLCRDLFSTLMELCPGKLSEIIQNKFDKSRFLCDDIVKNNLEEKFKTYIYSFVDVENYKDVVRVKSPYKLMKEAGYTLYKCTTEKEIQSFKKYYAQGEELCTFYSRRLNSCYVYFAVKDNVLKIKRKNFEKPTRQDEYGTSVISIQFSKDKNHSLSITNRYNHKVNNPDATFSNNLDNIIDGLTASFAKFEGMTQEHIADNFEIPGYVRANDGKYYKYNYEIRSVYYCPNNIIIDNFNIIKYPKEQIIIADYFIIDCKNKKIELYDKNISDSFLDNFGEIGNIRREKTNQGLKLIVEIENGEDIIVEINTAGQIIKYINKNVKEINSYFLNHNKFLQEISLPNVETIEDSFMHYNNTLQKISLPNVKTIGGCFMLRNNTLQEINLPNVKTIGADFMYYNNTLQEINLLNVKTIGGCFMIFNNTLQEISVPNVKTIGDNFMYENKSLQKISL